MLLIRCPYCGLREQAEFAYGGEAHIARPTDSDSMSDAEWAEYVFMRSNTKGVFAERWAHVHGCRKWFNALRDTATDEFLAVYKTGEQPPAVGPRKLATPAGEPEIGSGNDATKVVRSEQGPRE
jgi:heterotetrameric sarcosine oxidase delta subunit